MGTNTKSKPANTRSAARKPRATVKVSRASRKRFEEINIPFLVIIMLAVVVGIGIGLADSRGEHLVLGLSCLVMSLAFVLLAIKAWTAKK